MNERMNSHVGGLAWVDASAHTQRQHKKSPSAACTVPVVGEEGDVGVKENLSQQWLYRCTAGLRTTSLERHATVKGWDYYSLRQSELARRSRKMKLNQMDQNHCRRCVPSSTAAHSTRWGPHLGHSSRVPRAYRVVPLPVVMTG